MVYLESAVHKVFIKQLFEDPPNALHKCCVQGFVIVFEINPSPKTRDDSFPLRGVSHHNRPAMLVISTDAHFEYVSFGFNTKFFVNFELNRQAVSIPTKTACHMMASLVGVTRDSILQRR